MLGVDRREVPGIGFPMQQEPSSEVETEEQDPEVGPADGDLGDEQEGTGATSAEDESAAEEESQSLRRNRGEE